MSMVEWGVIGLSAVGAYKGVKGKAPALRNTFSKAKISELFGLSRAKKAATIEENIGVGKASSSVVDGSSSSFSAAEQLKLSSTKKTPTNIIETNAKTLRECSTIELGVKMAEHQYKHNSSFGSVAGTKSHKKASDFSSKLLEKYGESMGLTKDNIQFEAQYFKRISKEEAYEAGIVFPKSGYSRYDVIDLKNGIILDYKFFSYDRPSTQIFNKNRLDRMIANAPKSVNEIYGIKPVFDGNIHTGKFEAVKVWDRMEK